MENQEPQQAPYSELKEHVTQAVQMLKTLSNEARLMILCALEDKEYSVTALYKQIGLSQSALSQHLAMLRREGMVQTRRESQVIYYSLAQNKSSRIIKVLSDMYCPNKADRNKTLKNI